MAKKKKETRIKAEKKRLFEKYENLPKETLAVVDGLIDRAAFMRIQLDDMEDDINENGAVEMFQQSDNMDPYERERPVMKQYVALGKNYLAVVKQLDDKLPKEEKEAAEKEDAFINFLGRR